MNKTDLSILDMSCKITQMLNEYSVLLNSNINQGLTTEFDTKKAELINWIEEIEFTINNYPCDC